MMLIYAKILMNLKTFFTCYLMPKQMLHMDPTASSKPAARFCFYWYVYISTILATVYLVIYSTCYPLKYYGVLVYYNPPNKHTVYE